MRTFRRAWQDLRWPLIAGLAIVTVLFGYWGAHLYFAAQGIPRSFWDKAYVSLQLFVLHPVGVEPPVPWQFQTARFLAAVVTFSAATGAIAAILREQMAHARVRWLAHDHVVVCGLGRTGRLLTHTFGEDNNQIVAVEKDPENVAIEESREEGATVFVGDAADPATLVRTRVQEARYLFAVSGDDGANAQVAMVARELVEDRRDPPLTCLVRILDADLAELLGAEIAARSTPGFRLEFFNPAERGAPALLSEHPPFDAMGDTAFGPPHLLVVGLGEMGGRLVVHAARLWWATFGPNNARFRVTVVDNRAGDHIESLLLGHPEVEKVCELVPQEIEVGSAEFDRAEFLLDPVGHQVTGVYVCLSDDALGISAALRLRRHLAGRPGFRVPIVVRTKQHGGLGKLLVEQIERSEELHVFGLLDLTCKPEVLLMGRNETLARAIHEDYVRKQVKEGHTPADNPSMVPWTELPEHLKESNRRQADDIGNKLRAIGCSFAPLADEGQDSFTFGRVELELLARMEHDRWVRERESNGWKYAPKKDAGRKESPYLVPWEELPEDVKELDRNAVRAIPDVLAGAGLRVVRLQQQEGGDGEDRSN